LSPVRPPSDRRARRTTRPRRLPPGPGPKARHDRAERLRVEFVSIGRELLRGRVPDTNGAWLADWFSRRGAVVHRIVVVDDSERAVTGAVSDALGRGAHLVVTTGGLGPALDDRTVAAISDALRLPLSVQPRARDLVETAYARLEREKKVARGGLTAAREKMAALPVGGEPIPNPVGIAPGVLVRLSGGGAVLSLPGAPDEMRATFEEAVPRLRELAPRGAAAQREVEAPTADESALRPLLERLAAEYPDVWIQSRPADSGRKDAVSLVTLEAVAPTKNEAESVVETAVKRLIALAAGA
jgi:nicotinamide-nucleotide amidase